MKKLLFTTLIKAPLLLLIGISTLGSLFYLWSPVYDFHEPTPFGGDSIYNPYANIDSTLWRRSNFHAHHRMWGGLTNGGCSREELIAAYSEMEYDFIGISNYQSMSDWRKGTSQYIPLYEQGWGITKFHQLIFGAKQTTWFDYPFFTTLSQRQYLLDLAHRDADLVVFNHPRFTRFMPREDMRYLSGYEAIEAIAGMANSQDYWDEALSAGHALFIVANDDSHNINKLYQLARYATFVNSPTTDYTDLTKALKAGHTYGLRIPNFGSGDKEVKLRENKLLPRPHLTQQEKRFTLSLDQPATRIRFIGQGGVVRAEATDTTQLSVEFEATDSYLRAEATFENGVELYLNPIYRYSDAPHAFQKLHQLNFFKSLLLSFGWLILVLLQGWLLLRIARWHLRD